MRNQFARHSANTVGRLSLSTVRGVRSHCNVLCLVLCLAAVGCASLPDGWKRPDGRQIDSKQLLVDRATCEGEIKTNLPSDSQTVTWGPTEDARMVYIGCMARHGYTGAE